MRVVWSALVLFGLLLQANDGAAQKVAGDTAEARLTGVHLFAFGGVGRAGRKSQGQKDYGEVMSQPDRLQVLERVVEAGTPEAKAFALVGIRNLDRGRFATLASPLRSSEVGVRMGIGCLVGLVNLGKIVHDIEAGEYAQYV